MTIHKTGAVSADPRPWTPADRLAAHAADMSARLETLIGSSPYLSGEDVATLRELRRDTEELRRIAVLLAEDWRYQLELVAVGGHIERTGSEVR